MTNKFKDLRNIFNKEKSFKYLTFVHSTVLTPEKHKILDLCRFRNP